MNFGLFLLCRPFSMHKNTALHKKGKAKKTPKHDMTSVILCGVGICSVKLTAVRTKEFYRVFVQVEMSALWHYKKHQEVKIISRIYPLVIIFTVNLASNSAVFGITLCCFRGKFDQKVPLQGRSGDL